MNSIRDHFIVLTLITEKEWETIFPGNVINIWRPVSKPSSSVLLDYSSHTDVCYVYKLNIAIWLFAWVMYSSDKIMGLIRDWTAYLLFITSLCSFINSFDVRQINHIPEITNRKINVERYQLLGGNFTLYEFRNKFAYLIAAV